MSKNTANCGMKVIILGSGSATPDPERAGPSQVVVVDEEVMLFDCGERTTINLIRANLNPNHVKHLFFTHLHRDHIADLGYFIMTTHICGRNGTLHIFGPRGTKKLVESLFEVYRTELDFIRYRAKLKRPQKYYGPKPDGPPLVDVIEIAPGFKYTTDDTKVIAGPAEHYQKLGLPSVSYRIETRHGVIVISGDTRKCKELAEFAKNADLLIHESAFIKEIINERRITGHSSPADAASVAELAGAKKLVLTHLGPYTSTPIAVDMAYSYYGNQRDNSVWNEMLLEAKQNYSGPVLLAYDGMVIDFKPICSKP